MHEENADGAIAPRWLPDLFAWLYETLRSQAGAISSAALAERCDPAEIDRLRNLINAAPDGNAPTDLLAYVETAEDRASEDAVIVARLVAASAIDDAFDELRRDSLGSPGHLLPTPPVEDVRNHYLIERNCAKDPRYLVLPSEEPPARSRLRPSGDNIDFLFKNLRVLVRRDIPKRWTIAMAGISRRSVDAGLRRKLGDLDHLRIAIAPLAETFDDVTINGIEYRGDPRVDISLQEAQEQRLIERVQEIVDLAAKSEAHVLVLPEWIVPPGVSKAVGEAIRRAAKGASTIQLVIAGTGATAERKSADEPPYAECTIYDGSGRIVWKQRKMHHWRMSEDAQAKAGVPPRPEGRTEHFESHDTVVVADTLIGRSVVLICEDFQQDSPGRDIVRALGPRWVFVPVFDTSLEAYRWSPEKAKDLARAFETSVVVANSLVLPSRTPGMGRFGWFVSRMSPSQFVVGEIELPSGITPIFCCCWKQKPYKREIAIVPVWPKERGKETTKT